MALEKHIYKIFEDIVGPENISQEPAVLDSYSWRQGQGARMDKFVPRFEAIILPKYTEEVQAIVKLCNRYMLQFKASSTDWATAGTRGGPNIIKIDLRRMSKIIEINEKNMYAVVEPYVIYAQLQAELMKKGLNCNVIGAGSNCSALPLAAHGGIGHMGQSASCGERNLLAVEWVTPEGEIVKLGSLGSADEWFCGDGPGSSLRGIIRGGISAMGGIGVFTKAAVKVYHWPGPSIFPIEGVSPHYAPSQTPERFMIRFFSFPSIEKMLEAERKIGESEISFELMGFNAAMIASNIATSNDEDFENLNRLRSLMKGHGFLVIVAGNSNREFEYQQRVLQKIIDETKGKSLELIEDPKIGGGLLWRCIRITASIRETFRATGTWGGALAGTDIFAKEVYHMEKAALIKKDLIRRGLARDDGGGILVWAQEHGHLGHGEMLLQYSTSPESIKGAVELATGSDRIALDDHYGVPHGIMGNEKHDMFGPYAYNYHLWLKKIKKAFDPNEAADPTFYISAKK